MPSGAHPPDIPPSVAYDKNNPFPARLVDRRRRMECHVRHVVLPLRRFLAPSGSYSETPRSGSGVRATRVRPPPGNLRAWTTI